METNRYKHLKKARRVVVKVGSGVLTARNGLNIQAIRSISRQISILMDQGREVVLVSSGAMASGMKKIGLAKRPTEIPKRQAIAAVGQAGLIQEWEAAFGQHDRKVAQVLLTREDLCDRKRYLNARNTLRTLLSWKVVPVINENDTVAVEELKFGDNDNLAAMITLLMDADILVNLTDIDGLYTKDPRVHADAELIPVVDSISRGIERLASDIPGTLGTGGMLSKIRAAKKVTRSGIPMIIAKGEKKDILGSLFSGAPHGTFFVPEKSRLSSRKGWIAFTLKPQGALTIDDGAARAILNNGKSLLPIGITDVRGDFNVGACVEFFDGNETKLGIGLVNYSAADIRKIKGLKTNEIEMRLGYKPYDEVIHRDNLTLAG
ncbi:MAG: glutamate 5-kinase [Thermodesulfobacteriota bacterium]